MSDEPRKHDFNWITGPEPDCRYCGMYGPTGDASSPCPGGDVEKQTYLRALRPGRSLEKVDLINNMSGMRPLTDGDLQAQRATHEADSYINACEQRRPFTRHYGQGYACIPMLAFLKGKPWDAMALNYIEALEPKAMRVILKGMVINDDSVHGRVTVFIAEDGRTIERVEKEVEVGLRGCRFGADLNLHR